MFPSVWLPTPRQAHSIYMDLAIGRAPWPIGATSVGIHARAARERIQSSKIAHVMNDEVCLGVPN